MARWLSIAVGVGLALAALAVYLTTHMDRYYDHFVWQASAFLEGQAAIRFPVEAGNGLHGNAYFQDVLPVVTSDGVARGLLPFPPLPALVLLPFVAIWGLATNDQVIFTILAAVDVAICWWTIGRLPVGPVVRLGTTIFFAFGTVFWYSAQVSTTWYQAHTVAIGLTLLAIGLAVKGDPASIEDEPDDVDEPPEADVAPRTLSRRRSLAVDPRQFAAGFLFGLACTARLTVVFGAPSFALVGSGGGWRRRTWSLASTTSSRPATCSTRPTTTSTASRLRATRGSATTSTGASRTRAICPRTWASPCSGCRTSSRPACPTAWPSIRHLSASGPIRPAACSTWGVRWRFRATPG
jgi:hypothetical protein